MLDEGIKNQSEREHSSEDLNEEEKHYMLEMMELDEEELHARGRNSVLEEVEDDDIVNQNSSKSSSKDRSSVNSISKHPHKSHNVIRKMVMEEEKKERIQPHIKHSVR